MLQLTVSLLTYFWCFCRASSSAPSVRPSPNSETSSLPSFLSIPQAHPSPLLLNNSNEGNKTPGAGSPEILLDLADGLRANATLQTEKQIGTHENQKGGKPKADSVKKLKSPQHTEDETETETETETPSPRRTPEDKEDVESQKGEKDGGAGTLDNDPRYQQAIRDYRAKGKKRLEEQEDQIEDENDNKKTQTQTSQEAEKEEGGEEETGDMTEDEDEDSADTVQDSSSSTTHGGEKETEGEEEALVAGARSTQKQKQKVHRHRKGANRRLRKGREGAGVLQPSHPFSAVRGRGQTLQENAPPPAPDSQLNASFISTSSNSHGGITANQTHTSISPPSLVTSVTNQTIKADPSNEDSNKFSYTWPPSSSTGSGWSYTIPGAGTGGGYTYTPPTTTTPTPVYRPPTPTPTRPPTTTTPSPSPTPSPGGGGDSSSAGRRRLDHFNEAEAAREIANIQNKLRTQHGLKALAWDSQLASLAKSYSASTALCSSSWYGHSPADTRTKVGPFFWVGENLWRHIAPRSVDEVVDGWFKEHYCYRYGPRVNPRNLECELDCGSACTSNNIVCQAGHFRQMFYEENTHIGCGVSQCGPGGRYWNVICNYGTEGGFGMPDVGDYYFSSAVAKNVGLNFGHVC